MAAAQAESDGEVRDGVPKETLNIEEIPLGTAGSAYRLTTADKNQRKYDSVYFRYGEHVYLSLSHISDRDAVLKALRSIGPPREVRLPPVAQAMLTLPWGQPVLISPSLCASLEASHKKTEDLMTLLYWMVVGFFVLAATWGCGLYVFACAQTYFLLPLAVGIVMLTSVCAQNERTGASISGAS